MVKYQDYSHSGPFSHCRGKLGQCGNTVVAALSELCNDCKQDAEKGGRAVEAEAKKLVAELEHKPAEPAEPVAPPQAAPAANEKDAPPAPANLHPEAVTESTVKPVALPEAAVAKVPEASKPEAVAQSTSQPGPKIGSPSEANDEPKRDGVPIESAQPERKPVSAEAAAKVEGKPETTKAVSDHEVGGADEGVK